MSGDGVIGLGAGKLRLAIEEGDMFICPPFGMDELIRQAIAAGDRARAIRLMESKERATIYMRATRRADGTLTLVRDRTFNKPPVNEQS